MLILKHGKQKNFRKTLLETTAAIVVYSEDGKHEEEPN